MYGQLLIDPMTQVRVYDSVLVEELNYKAILISEETTVEDVIRSIAHFYSSRIFGFHCSLLIQGGTYRFHHREEPTNELESLRLMQYIP